MTIALDTELSQLVTDAVDESLKEVFEMMAGQPVTQLGRCLPELTESGVPKDQHPLTVTLGLSGDLCGTVGLCLSGAAACQWAEDITGEPASEISQDVIDAAGELGNMVVGGAKRRLSSHDLKMGLPNVILAAREAFVFPSEVHPIYVEYAYSDSKFDVIIALAPQG